MSSFKFKLDEKGVRQLLKSQEMLNICTQHANEIQQKAGEGYEVSTYVGRNRVNASVITATYEAMRDNLENNTLLKARGGGK